MEWLWWEMIADRRKPQSGFFFLFTHSPMPRQTEDKAHMQGQKVAGSRAQRPRKQQYQVGIIYQNKSQKSVQTTGNLFKSCGRGQGFKESRDSRKQDFRLAKSDQIDHRIENSAGTRPGHYTLEMSR